MNILYTILESRENVDIIEKDPSTETDKSCASWWKNNGLVIALK